MSTTITTPAELDALPVDSVIKDSMGDVGIVDRVHVHYPETAPITRAKVGKAYLPATVLYRPDAEPAPAAVVEPAEVFEFEDVERLYASEIGDTLVISSEGRLWLAWMADTGDWFAVRPRDDGDDLLPADDDDRWRPIGPLPMEQWTFPVTAVVAHEALEVSR